MFDGGSLTINKPISNPLQNHSYKHIDNVHNKAGNEPITREEFAKQLAHADEIGMSWIHGSI